MELLIGIAIGLIIGLSSSRYQKLLRKDYESYYNNAVNDSLFWMNMYKKERSKK